MGALAANRDGRNTTYIPPFPVALRNPESGLAASTLFLSKPEIFVSTLTRMPAFSPAMPQWTSLILLTA
jgi:hypothetical protein